MSILAFQNYSGKDWSNFHSIQKTRSTPRLKKKRFVSEIIWKIRYNLGHHLTLTLYLTTKFCTGPNSKHLQMTK